MSELKGDRARALLRLRAAEIVEQKHPVRRQLEADVEAYLAKGGTVTAVPTGQSGVQPKVYGRWTGISL